jgi:hypothetical protein
MFAPAIERGTYIPTKNVGTYAPPAFVFNPLPRGEGDPLPAF